MVVIQMMAYAKPVIATAVNGIPDYITHMENGLLIDATKEKDIINAGAAFVELLLQNKTLRIEMGLKNRKIAVERFSKELFNSSYQHLLSS